MNLIIAERAKKDLERIPRTEQQRIGQAIERLLTELNSHTPFPTNTKKLINTDDLYRLRVGNYRIIYTTADATNAGDKILYILAVGIRGQVYKGL
jgi:mRNA interferase RelE/StbE